ncbi:serine hydrolase [Ideonella sp.]|uniref:serine hydrolase n=1 Tax=Ideonella sp. TaxID=1929293 RepID=UPI002B4831A3|nr:serine hydrolase [Ideonella sp.]HJV72523.1 serine hydrolase [Ideonella sp.]
MKTRFARQPRPTLLLAALAAAAGLMLHGGARADEPMMMDSADDMMQVEALDTNALTDDHSVNAPTAWWTYTNVSADQIGTYINNNGARLTDIEVYSVSNGVPRFTVRMVKNSGAYAVPGWWWYYGLTAAQVTSYVNANNGRLIEVEPYDIGGGVIRFAVVMVSNTAGAARAWSYLMGVSSAQISDHIANSGHRMIDIDSYTEGGVKKYSAAFVANTGADAKSWQWWLNQSPASIASKVSSFQGRIVKLERQADGTYNFIQVKNTGTDNSAWWYQYGFASMADLNNYGLQVASRPIDITTYVSNGVRRYDAVFIDNANASTRRMRDLLGQTFLDASGNPTKGIFESYLKQVNGAIKVDLNSTRRAETASSLKSLHLLHSMKQVEAGLDTLPSAFTYYEYDMSKGKDACPDPSKEIAANARFNYNFETGLDQMMSISDNRTTRGTVLRYGGTFTPFNNTASASKMTGTTLRHNIGCAYWNLSTQKYDPATRRNDTTAADLAHIYEGVWNQTLLTNTNSARDEFLESANPGSGVSASLQAIINDEAAKQGKSAIAAQFGSLVRSWGKGGSYDTCLPDANGGCGTMVIVRSGTGLIRFPIYTRGVQGYRDYVFGRLISDTPVTCWEDWNTAGTECPIDTSYTNAYSNAANELYRDEIREALKTW